MHHSHVQYLLVGGGVASFSAAQAIRQRDPRGPVLLVGQEINRPYRRDALHGSFLRREIPREALFTSPPGWFTQHQIALRTRCRAAQLDTHRSIVTLDSGEAISYDRLLLATGALAAPLNVPGATLPNVFALHTIENVEHVHTMIDKARHEGRVHPRGRGRCVVLGDGPLALSAAASLATASLQVEMVLGGPYPGSRLWGESAGRFVSRFLSDRGVVVRSDAALAALEGDGRVQRVVLADGTIIECDFVVTVQPEIPNKELLRNTQIVAEKGILADEYCRTSEPNIFAAGQCAMVRDPLSGRHRLADDWDTAAITGELAGKNMAAASAGERVAFDHIPALCASVFDLPIKAWGEARAIERRLIRGDTALAHPHFLEFGLTSAGAIALVVAFGRLEDHVTQIIGLIRNKVVLNGAEELFKDDSISLKDLMAKLR